jgi:DNA-3-methyladenine glycosylase II
VAATTSKIAMRGIRNEKDLKEGVTALVKSCAHLARVHALAGDPPLRRRPSGFKGLVRVITSQQLSVASAGAIWWRLEASVEPFTAIRFLSVPERDLRAAGLSKSKIVTLRGLAESIESGSFDLDALSQEPEDVIHAKLTVLKGIGPWTADIYMLFCLARADAWSPDDLALQLVVKDALDLEARPNQTLMIELAEAWRPWRAVAARMLWSYYAVRRKTSAAPA